MLKQKQPKLYEMRRSVLKLRLSKFVMPLKLNWLRTVSTPLWKLNRNATGF